VLSDHYDPRQKTLRLSADIYHGRSVTAAGIAAHEVGHAIQHKEGYGFMKMRQAMVPVANIGTNVGIVAVIGGLVIGVTSLAVIGVVLFAGFVAFTLVTLPVEFDASARAKRVLATHGIVSGEEAVGVNQVLTAAAATYVAAAVTAILQLVYWLYRLGLIGGRR
jgi:Zn-dependent membrane protease YugP